MIISTPRYTQFDLPSYRYLPTVNPHPGIDPNGHSYEKEEREVPFLPPEAWRQNQNYLYGVDLFNNGYWWEAHEAWEGAWLTTEKSDYYGQFLQALIQYSAAILKLYSGTLKGFNKLYGEAEKRIHFVLEELGENEEKFMGLAIKEWLTRMENFKKQVKDPEGQVIDPLELSAFPFIELGLDS